MAREDVFHEVGHAHDVGEKMVVALLGELEMLVWKWEFCIDSTSRVALIVEFI
jgi:hypothetical protein